MTGQNDLPLALLSAIVNHEHHKFTKQVDLWDAAVRAGDALMVAKELLPNGSYTAWVENNCDCDVRRAQDYVYRAKDAPHPLPLWDAWAAFKA